MLWFNYKNIINIQTLLLFFLVSSDIRFIKREIAKMSIKLDKLSEVILPNADNDNTDIFPIKNEVDLLNLEKMLFDNKVFSRQIVS